MTGPIPSVMVHGGQLQQVILNLIRNAGEAMDAVSNRERVLRVRSAIHNTNEVLVSIEDSGPPAFNAGFVVKKGLNNLSFTSGNEMAGTPREKVKNNPMQGRRLSGAKNGSF